MKSTSIPLKIFIVTLTCATFIMVTTIAKSSFTNKELAIIEELKAEIRSDLYLELRAEMKKDLEERVEKIVREKVAAEIEFYMAQRGGEISELLDILAKNSSSELSPFDKGSLEQATQRLVQEVVARNIELGLQSKLSDKELDQVVGSYIRQDLQLDSGLYKSPQDNRFYIAKASDATSESTQPPTLPEGGDGVERPESIERTLQDKGSVLLPKGTLQIEPSFSWAHFSSNRLNITGFSILPILVVGDVSTESVKRDIFIETLALKYGAFNNFQAEIKFPFKGQYNRITDRSENEGNTSGTTGIGDIEFGISRQIGWEHGLMPDLIAAFNVKTPSGKDPFSHSIGLGTGHWAVRGSLIAAKSSDPVVIFGSLSYTANLEETFDAPNGTINPGDNLGYSLGTAIALSYQTAINFSFNHSISQKLKQNDAIVRGTFLNVASLKTGFNWAINEKSSVNFGISFGVTEDAPDVVLDLRFPHIF